jgi:phosphate transport system permease protein
MAVTFVIGNMNQLNSLSVSEAGEGLHQASLIYLGLVLFFITFVVLACSKVLLNRLQKSEGARS